MLKDLVNKHKGIDGTIDDGATTTETPPRSSPEAGSTHGPEDAHLMKPSISPDSNGTTTKTASKSIEAKPQTQSGDGREGPDVTHMSAVRVFDDTEEDTGATRSTLYPHFLPTHTDASVNLPPLLSYAFSLQRREGRNLIASG